MAEAAGGAAVGAAGNLIGGGMDAMGQAHNNIRQGRAAATSAANVHDLVRSEILNRDTSGLEREAGRVLSSGQDQLNAQLAQRGIYNSGAAMSQHRQLSGDVMSQLADAINQDQFSRASAAGQLYSQPGFGFYDTQTGQPTNQGK